MKRSLAVAVIVGYLAVLGGGIVSHTLSVGNVSHPAMYYVVWDMFCGWSGYENRQHLIAEGVSGKHYSLVPSPWGEFKPYGPAYRPDYDSFGVHCAAIAKNVLKHTKHEPIRRVYLIEENWSKRYNMPDKLWKRQFEEVKDPQSYFHTRVVYDEQCQQLQRKNSWTSAIYNKELSSDPRLTKYMRGAKPLYVITPKQRSTVTPSQPPQNAQGNISPALLGN
ncbi:MAG: hypothetical protein JKY95_01390 [Planctomycetaceae bacterium]|nr:hypothetical protein [Planctomycetaceae bacterium]